MGRASLGPVAGFFDEIGNRFGRKFQKKLETLEESTDREVEAQLVGLTHTQLTHLGERIKECRERVSVGAAYDNEVVAISKQILAFGIAGVAFTAAFARDISSLPAAVIDVVAASALFYFNLLLLSLYTLFSFVWQSRFRYPFLYFSLIGNTRPYFYYASIAPNTRRATFQTAEEKMLGAELYAKDLLEFVRLHTVPTEEAAKAAGGREGATETREGGEAAALLEEKLRGKRREIRADLQQYFLLISYQGYVNQYEVRLNNHFLYGLVGSSVVALASYFVLRGL